MSKILKSDNDKDKKKDDLEKHAEAAADEAADEEEQGEGDEGDAKHEDESDDEPAKGKDENDETAEEESEEDESESDEEDEEDEEGDAEDEEDEEDEKVAAKDASAGGFAAKYGATLPRARARRPQSDDHDDQDDAGANDDEDASWWAPHAVLGGLVVVGMLGFFGVFNHALAFLRPTNMKADASTASGAATPPPPPQPAQPTPPRPPMDQQAQAPREMFGAKHLLVMYAGSRRAPPDIKRTKDEAKARATEAAKKAKDGKTKFEDVVKDYTDEPGGAGRGGDLGTFPKGSMVPEFQAGLDKLKVGEISDVVESPFGFHVILRTK